MILANLPLWNCNQTDLLILTYISIYIYIYIYISLAAMMNGMSFQKNEYRNRSKKPWNLRSGFTGKKNFHKVWRFFFLFQSLYSNFASGYRPWRFIYNYKSCKDCWRRRTKRRWREKKRRKETSVCFSIRRESQNLWGGDWISHGSWYLYQAP